MMGVVLALAITLALQLSPGQEAVPLEPGATDVDGGLTGQGACVQDGVAGAWAIDGSCVTPVDFARLFSNEALAAAGVAPHPEPDPLRRSVAFDPEARPHFTFEIWLGQLVGRSGQTVAL